MNNILFTYIRVNFLRSMSINILQRKLGHISFNIFELPYLLKPVFYNCSLSSFKNIRSRNFQISVKSEIIELVHTNLDKYQIYRVFFRLEAVLCSSNFKWAFNDLHSVIYSDRPEELKVDSRTTSVHVHSANE